MFFTRVQQMFLSDLQNAIFCLVLFGTALVVSLYALRAQRSLRWWLKAQALVVGVAILYLGAVVFEPILFEHPAAPPAEQHVQLPAYDYQVYHALPVEMKGREKPLESACIETVREITGKQRFEKQDPVAIVLSWVMLRNTLPHQTGTDLVTDWEHYPFILCQDRELRKTIYEHLADKQGGQLTEEQRHGKYIAPADLRDSPGLKKLMASIAEKEQQDQEKAMQLMTPAERKAQEVAGRLSLYDSISQKIPPLEPGRPQRQPEDPLCLVALDQVHGGAWFSLGELHAFQSDPHKADPRAWREAMAERLKNTPQLYVTPEAQQALHEFQDQIKAGQGMQALDDLGTQLEQRDDQQVRDFEKRHPGKIMVADLQDEPILRTLTETERNQIGQWLRTEHPDAASGGAEAVARLEVSTPKLAKTIRDLLTERRQKVIDKLRHRLSEAMNHKYHPDDQRFRMLHLDYLESRFPDLYVQSVAWQKYPRAKVERVLEAYGDAKDAYLSGDPAQFAQASHAFFDTLRTVSEEVGPYPGTDTIGQRLGNVGTGIIASIFGTAHPPGSPGPQLINLELTFNHLQPFMWAWIIMLGSLLLFGASLFLSLGDKTPTGSARWVYWLGFLPYVASLGFMIFGLFARVAIAGRPPVTNMYETVVWVAFMSSVFALVLELIYRPRVIVLAGTVVATFALVLADQLPLVLDPKIGQLVPVLRSNYWLTIHVLTIVSSYAGGTLAWGLGNLALLLLAFGRPRPELVKTLSQYTYRAMQIAVLLLAAGTFLGGWWAAESWGRFWGWDPKEVWALIALVCYVIPLHMRYIGWVKDFGLAVSAVLCYAAIVMSWYGVNFVLGAGLHSYGFGGGGPWWVFWGGLVNIEWVLLASLRYHQRVQRPTPPVKTREDQLAAV